MSSSKNTSRWKAIRLQEQAAPDPHRAGASPHECTSVADRSLVITPDPSGGAPWHCPNVPTARGRLFLSPSAPTASPRSIPRDRVEHKVPIVRDSSGARSLYARSISIRNSRRAVQAVAEIISYVMRLKGGAETPLSLARLEIGIGAAPQDDNMGKWRHCPDGNRHC